MRSTEVLGSPVVETDTVPGGPTSVLVAVGRRLRSEVDGQKATLPAPVVLCVEEVVGPVDQPTHNHPHSYLFPSSGPVPPVWFLLTHRWSFPPHRFGTGVGTQVESESTH